MGMIPSYHRLMYAANEEAQLRIHTPLLAKEKHF